MLLLSTPFISAINMTRGCSNRRAFLLPQGNQTKVDVILEVLGQTVAQHSEWVLWVEQNALVLNPAYTFPFSKYMDAGHSIVMYGNPDDAISGSVNGAQDFQFCRVPFLRRLLRIFVVRVTRTPLMENFSVTLLNISSGFAAVIKLQKALLSILQDGLNRGQSASSGFGHKP